MFPSLPHIFKKHQLNADVRTLLQLRKAMERGLVHTLGDLYLVLKALITNDPKDFGPFTTAFYEYFLAIEIKNGESLESALLRSETFQDWRSQQSEETEDGQSPSVQELIDRYLDEVHLSSFDIQKIIDGQTILEKEDPNQVDTADANTDPGRPEHLNQLADYRNSSMEELLRRMEAVARQQKGKHNGGNHWIGSGGISPYGNNGAAAGGIRVGGSGGGKMARKVVNDRRFYPADTKAILKDDNIDAALAILKGIEDESAEVILDIPTTIKEGLKQGGIFLPYEREKINNKVQVILLIDNGGLSMSPYVKSVQKLFAKMKTRFAHDLKTYYYHNTIYKGAYSDVRRTQFVPIEKIASENKNYSVFIVGDADMAPYELGNKSIECWKVLTQKYKRIAWMNPMKESYWSTSSTIPMLRRVVPMYPLTPEGIEKAIAEMNRKRRYNRRLK
ncbi:MAG: hypothetical protein AAF985_06855 [Bacteroidota bacterium]